MGGFFFAKKKLSSHARNACDEASIYIKDNEWKLKNTH